MDDLLIKIRENVTNVNKSIIETAEKEEFVRFDSGAVRSKDVDHLRYDLIPTAPMERLALRYGMGAEKYGDWNWQKGMPDKVLVNHLEAHLQKWKSGDRSEDHMSAVAWGAFAIMYFDDQRVKQAKNQLKEGHNQRAVMDAGREDINESI